jgi:type I restriction-modification system DNA methylase subunit
MSNYQRTAAEPNATTANLGFESKLWAVVDELRNTMDAAEYKHVVLGLTCLKYISDAFEEQHAKLMAEQTLGADPEDPGEYRRYPDLKADYVLADPPFNDIDWRGELLQDEKRWVYGVPPCSNVNYAWGSAA